LSLRDFRNSIVVSRFWFCNFSCSCQRRRARNLREAKDALGRNALHVAAGKGHLEVCRFLVEESGLDVNSTASGSGTLVHLAAVHLAAVGGHERVLEYLLDRGVDPGVPDANGSTPLHHAAEQGAL